MTSSKRRTLLLAAAVTPFIHSFASAATPPDFAAIERDLGGRLGVAAIDLATGRIAGNRQDERFPMASTFKATLAAAMLARDAREPGFIDKRLRYTKADLLSYAPVTSKHVEDGMTVAELCAATVQLSDNTAANVLLKELGGPQAVTAFARSIGDTTFRLDRWEPELNAALAGDARDTTTPLAMARTLQKLLVGDGLPAPQRRQLNDWMIGTTTGDKRIRAAAPAGWQVGDKTGTGGYGSTNDIGIAYPPAGSTGRGPVVIAIYTHQPAKDAPVREDIVAAAARAAFAALGIR
ncbi:beta-lactamase class A [Pseudoduganella lurida]|uniref:Beta-lactamase n=1 Tax=Pseudoduganella lurida TaxID=1036180 RepID=A0A562RKS1_9BURK|nr:class A beta-lactamase [Pseudoduganella lurida]TWI69647.1 beta-lactamase class A [Pseudoduganella lurida]